MACNGDYCEIERWPEKRELDGVYFRVQRDGKWENVCFTDLTEDEVEQVTANKDMTWWKSLAMYLARTLRGIGDQFNIKAEEE